MEKQDLCWKKKKIIIGMVHLRALPGTPGNVCSMQEISETALEEALLLERNSFDGIILENMHDIPYLNKKVGPEITAAISVIAEKIKKRISLCIGVQILAGANREALAVAKAAGLDFIRAEGFVFSHIADEGLINSDAGKLLRYRKNIGADRIKIFTDIKKKHSSHAITSDITTAEFAEAAQFFASDGLILTGKASGKEASIEEIKEIYSTANLPVLIGSGISKDNIRDYWKHADGFIIGSSLKEKGFWKNSLSESRIVEFMNKVAELRKRK